MLPLLLIQTRKRIYEQRGIQKGILQFIIQKRELSSHGLNVSPTNANNTIYNMWQPSLVLGRLSGALRVSMACESPILALALQAF